MDYVGGEELDHEKAELITQRLRMLGTQITETGIRPCASPVGRIMLMHPPRSRLFLRF